MLICADIAPHAKTQRAQRWFPRSSHTQVQNRVMKKTGAATPDAYSFSFANKLTNIVVGATNATHRYFYDLAGNLVTSVVNNITNIYFYNAQNKLALVRINYPDGDYVLYNFLYDSLNRRVCIGRAEARRPFLPSPYDWQMQIHDGNVPIAVSHPADAIDRLFVRGVGIAEGTGDVIAEIIGTDANNAKAVFYLTNHRGDTLEAYRGDKTLVAKYRYDAFGNQRTAYCVVNEPENAPRYTFSTKEYLPAAGLYLYQYRAYDPIAGRWTQRDPIDYQDSINLYQFCGNNGVNLWDLDGRVVYVKSRNVMGPLGVVACHTWVEVIDSNGNKTTFSGTRSPGGRLGVVQNYGPDFNAKEVTSQQEIKPPEGVSQNQWDHAVLIEGKKQVERQHNQREYDLFGGDNGQRSGNCHVVTRQIIRGAGGEIPDDYDPPKRNYGLHDKADHDPKPRKGR